MLRSHNLLIFNVIANSYILENFQPITGITLAIPMFSHKGSIDPLTVPFRFTRKDKDMDRLSLHRHSIIKQGISRVSLCVLILALGSTVFAHGGKSHAQGDFTALQALQKATTLYDRLIVSGKLDESWETGLKSVQVVTREKKGKREFRVGFERSEGKPDKVYIFLTSDGQYAGSNYDGD